MSRLRQNASGQSERQNPHAADAPVSVIARCTSRRQAASHGKPNQARSVPFLEISKPTAVVGEKVRPTIHTKMGIGASSSGTTGLASIGSSTRVSGWRDRAAPAASKKAIALQFNKTCFQKFRDARHYHLGRNADSGRDFQKACLRSLRLSQEPQQHSLEVGDRSD